MANCKSITNFSVKFGQRFFLDANVLLFIFYPDDRNSRNTDIYSDFLSKILNKSLNCQILINVQVVSEVINRIFQGEFINSKREGNIPSEVTLKEFRSMKEYKLVLLRVQQLVSRLVDICDVLSGEYSNIEIKEMIKNCDKGDFNDLIHLKFCEKNKLFLVTHDFDFNAIEDFDVQLISANKNYLS